MTTCPACGVAVVPGYVKCPKCGSQLPAVSRTKSRTSTPAFGTGTGTAVTERTGSSRTLYIALGAGLAVAIGLVVFLGGRGGGKAASTQAPPRDEPAETQPAQPTNEPAQPDEPVVTPTQPSQSGDDAQAAIADFDRELKRKRLWGTATINDTRVEVRSGSCDDSAMSQLIDSLRPRFHGAGLTKLRCLAQSGLVVFERDL